MDRRDLLKRFGVGAIIAPIIGGVVERSASAELIEIPKVKPFELFSKIPGPVLLNRVVSAQVVLEFRDGPPRTFSLDKWPYGDGEALINDRMAIEIEFFRVQNNSPQTEHKTGRLHGDAVLA